MLQEHFNLKGVKYQEVADCFGLEVAPRFAAQDPVSTYELKRQEDRQESQQVRVSWWKFSAKICAGCHWNHSMAPLIPLW